MISNPEEVSQLVLTALNYYDEAIGARKYLNHRRVFELCQKALSKIAIVSYNLSNDEITREENALNWVKELPIPNGLYPMLIKATSELVDRYFPLLNFALSYPTSSRNIYLIEDALTELLVNIKNNDETNEFKEKMENWKSRI